MLRTQNKVPAGRSILSVHLGQETDFLLARQRAKQIARLVGFDLQDQTRIATAVSEIARNAYEYGKGGKVEYFLDATSEDMLDHRPSGPVLRIVVTDGGKGIPHIEDIWSGTYQSRTGMGIGMIGARRLMDALDVETSHDGTRVTLIKQLPRAITIAPSVAEIAAVLLQETAKKGPSTGTAAIHDQNQELLTLLGDLRSRETPHPECRVGRDQPWRARSLRRARRQGPGRPAGIRDEDALSLRRHP
jgi:anti-sigma regulatory factor (Ser/Thr protein kinase)